MRKPLATRILCLTAVYCLVFCVLGVLQFSGKGNFNLTAGAMSLRGRYLMADDSAAQESSKPVTGGVKIFYEGLEFNLKDERARGLLLSSGDGGVMHINPEYMMLTETSARFYLPGGSTLLFNSVDSSRGIELQINAEFADNVSKITIPITPRRSSLVTDNGQIGLMFGGSRYFLNTPGHELETGKMILSRDASFISFRQRGKQKIFDPADYIIANWENYDSEIRDWQNSSYAYWNQNVAALQNEDDIIALLAETIPRGNFTAAVNTIAPNLLNTPRHSYRSAVYTGGMTNAYQAFITSENNKLNLVTRSIRERSLAFLREEHIIDYLHSRGNTALANEIVDVVTNAEPQMLSIYYCAGLLEFAEDARRFYPNLSNPIDHLTEQMLLLVSDNLTHNDEDDTVFVSYSDGINLQYNTRLGKGLVYWARTVENTEWEAIGKSLVLSALSESNSGRLHNILNLAEYNPKAVLLTNTGHWAWTISPSVRMSFIGEDINIAFTFPVNMAHFVIIRGVRPFNRIQIHGMDWRTDSQFERYDSSGWVYYPQEQVLVAKLRHRAATENLRIIYREAAPPPPPPPPPAVIESPAEGAAVE